MKHTSANEEGVGREENPANEGLTVKAARGMKWNILATVVNAVLQLGYISAMARLLEPEAFGLMALGMAVIRFGRYFAQMGVTQALIQKPELQPKEIRAAFTGSLVLGIFFFLIFFFGAPLANLVFADQDLKYVVRALALSFLVTGLSATAVGLLRRQLRFKALALADMAAYIISYGIVGVPLALSGWGVWSLIFASLTQPLIQASVAYFYARHSIVPLFDWKVGLPLYRFGSQVSLISFFEYIGSTLDTFIIGRWMGSAFLGLYNRAYLLVNLPMEYFTGSISKVFLPAFSRMQEKLDRLKEVFLSAYSVMIFMILSLSLGIAAAADTIVTVVLGPDWADAIPLLQILAPAAALNFLSHLQGVLFEATAQLKDKMRIKGLYIFLLLGAFYVMKPYGMKGIAVAVLGSQLIFHLAYLMVTTRLFKMSIVSLVKLYFPGLVNAVVTAAGIYAVGWLLKENGVPMVVNLVAQMLTGAFLLIAMVRMPVSRGLRVSLSSRLKPLRAEGQPVGMKQIVLNRFLNWVEV